MSDSQNGLTPSPPTSGSADSSPTEQTRPRRKRWAPKVKTGCITCRVRRVKCDETKPHCKRCTAYGYVCDGYATTPGLPVSAAHQNHNTVRKSAAGFDPLHVVLDGRVAPPEWDFMESCRYYIEAILPMRQRDLDYAQQGAINLSTRNRPAFLLAMTAHRIGLISNAIDTLPHPSQMTSIAPLWSKLHSYMVHSIQEINTYIEGRSAFTKVQALLRISDLLSVELTLLGTAWRAHNSGFLTLLDSCNKAQINLPSSPIMATITQFQIAVAVVANTTSPASNQIHELDFYTLEEIANYFSVQIYAELPCPTELFLEMMRITKLRRLAMTSRNYFDAITPALDAILARIHAFDPETWDEPYHVPDQPEFLLMARVFKCSIALYANLSLPPPTSQSTPEVLKSWASRRIALREELLQLMRESFAILPSKAALCWPVAVAGVAVADGSEEDKVFIVSTFQTEQDKVPECWYVPKFYIEKLRGFWASGKLGWEDCWDEPFAPMA
ncbi:C6 zinc finger domain protein [Cordyceps fumosorosea ARSEF 2679]|uniref:C6 zinc finger domain protein n=1 Tax=Cordyceps fumosorosea (strain ARSEF 2679) TaxID=1081104 RepID=A0A162MSY3_CORFA|nr:C6 zinc finger domain protein [Cordyceps fumosorosea ARSEF 2679]OAA69829.1 C6 zinc finger domain protein [Cordyceps fumosorosea ARSEF 2679]